MQPNNLLTFHRRSAPLLTPAIIFGMLFLLSIFFIKTGEENGIGHSILLIIVILLFPHYQKKSHIRNNRSGRRLIRVTVNQWGWINKKALFPIAEIKITFKTEIKMGSINRKIFRLFHKKKQVVAIHSIAGVGSQRF